MRDLGRASTWALVLGWLLTGASANAGFSTSLTATVTATADGGYRYEYALTNQEGSSLNAFYLGVNVSIVADLGEFAGPSGWDVDYFPGDSLIAWTSGDFDTDLSPGVTAYFSFTSRLGPGDQSALVLGANEDLDFDLNQFAVASPLSSTVAVPEPAGVLMSLMSFMGVAGFVIARKDPKAS